MNQDSTGVRFRRSMLLLGITLFLVVLVSVLAGRYPQPYIMSPVRLTQDPLAQQLVLRLRLPRILTACLLGAVLSTTGLVLQMIFRNPLVEPGFLGVSQGASLGAALGIVLLGTSNLGTQALAILFALAGLALSVLLARRIRFGGWTLRLILAGIAVSAFFSACVGLLKAIADPLTQLPELLFWMLGGLWGITWRQAILVLIPSLIALTLAHALRWRLNILTLDEGTLISLGIAPDRERAWLLITVVTATAVLISVSGIISWVGLIVPQLARRWFGADNRRTLPAAMVMGAIFVCVTDTIARTALPGEIPLGILTALLGAVLFMLLLVHPSGRQAT